MPLIKSGSKKARKENFREMRRSGYSPKQALAAVLNTASQYGGNIGKKKKKKDKQSKHYGDTFTV